LQAVNRRNKNMSNKTKAKQTEEKVVNSPSIPEAENPPQTENPPEENAEDSEDETAEETEETSYSKPARPSWLKDEDTVLVKAKASPKGQAGIEYIAEVLTKSGAIAVMANNPDLGVAIMNNQVKAHYLAGYARKFGTGTYAFDWSKKPGIRGTKAAKEAAEKAAQLAADKAAYVEQLKEFNIPETEHETRWQAWLVKTGRAMAAL
jgi:hypothetical protein